MVPVVLLHGSRTSRTMWRHQAQTLSAAGVRAEAVDLPGHGDRRGEPFTMAGAVETVRDAVERAGGPALVVGLSLGGYVAIAHRAEHPDQSAGLVAASCSTNPTTWLRPAWLAVAQLIEGSPDGGARLNDALVRRMLSPEGAADIAAGGFALDVMSAVLRETGSLDTSAALAAATSPVWLVSGQLDHFRLHERASLAAARSSGAAVRHVVVRRAHHLVSLAAPVAFDRVLLEAVGSLSGAGSTVPVPASRRAQQGPGAHPADQGGGVGHDDDVVAQPVER